MSKHTDPEEQKLRWPNDTESNQGSEDCKTQTSIKVISCTVMPLTENKVSRF
jgi:hypothetical protein